MMLNDLSLTCIDLIVPEDIFISIFSDCKLDRSIIGFLLVGSRVSFVSTFDVILSAGGRDTRAKT